MQSEYSISQAILTDHKIVDFVSAALKWFEKHPARTVPSPSQTISLLTENDRIRQNKPIETYIVQDGFEVHQILGPSSTLPETTVPETESDVFTSDDLPHIREDGDSSPMDDKSTDNITKPRTDENAGKSMKTKNDVDTAEPKTPLREQPQGYWASILGANALANIVTSPLKLLSGRKTNARVPKTPATEVRRTHRSTATTSIKQAPATIAHPKIVRRGFYAPSDSGSDNGSVVSTSSINGGRRRGRQDAHLPLHLRGVLYKDLPDEWKAVSEHMRPALEPAPIEEFEAWQQMTREKRAKDRLLKEKEEQANLVYATRSENLRRRQEWAQAVKDGSVGASPVTVPGSRKRVIRVQKVYSARLGPSTYGMPENIDDSSSDEEIEIELDESMDEVLLTPNPKVPKLITKYDPSASKNTPVLSENSEETPRTASPTPNRTFTPQEAPETDQARAIRLRAEELGLDDVSSDEDDDEEYMGTAAGTYGDSSISDRQQMIDYMRKLSNSEEDFQARLEQFEAYRRWERKEIKKTVIYCDAEGIVTKSPLQAWQWRRVYPTVFPKLNPPPKIFADPRKARPYEGTTFPVPIQPARFTRDRPTKTKQSSGNMFSPLPDKRSEPRMKSNQMKYVHDPVKVKELFGEHLETEKEKKAKEEKAREEREKAQKEKEKEKEKEERRLVKGKFVETTSEGAIEEGLSTGSTLTATSASTLNVQTPSKDRASSQEDDSEVLAKARRDAMKHYPKKPSHLSNVKTMSPIQPPPPTPMSVEDLMIGISRTSYMDITEDPEVIAAVLSVPNDDFIVRNWKMVVPDKARSASVEASQYFETTNEDT